MFLCASLYVIYILHMLAYIDRYICAYICVDMYKYIYIYIYIYVCVCRKY